MPNPAGDNAITFLQFHDFLSRDIGFNISNSRIVLKRSMVEATNAMRAEPSAFPVDDINLLLLTGTSGPCVMIKQPYAVAYRIHDSNIVKRLAYMVDGLARLASFERQGYYPGGSARRFERYASFGGACSVFVYRALRQGQFRLTLKLLFHTGSMMVASVIKKLERRFHRPTPLRQLPD